MVSKYTMEFNLPFIEEQLRWIVPDVALTVRMSN